jgi:hypothetical protein
MDFSTLVSDPDKVPAAAKIRPAQGQVTRQSVRHGLGAFGVPQRHAAEVRQDPAIDQEIKIEAGHAGSDRKCWRRPAECARHLWRNCSMRSLLPEIPRERIARSADKYKLATRHRRNRGCGSSLLPAAMRISTIEGCRHGQTRHAQILARAAIPGLDRCDVGLSGNVHLIRSVSADRDPVDVHAHAARGA